MLFENLKSVAALKSVAVVCFCLSLFCCAAVAAAAVVARICRERADGCAGRATSGRELAVITAGGTYVLTIGSSACSVLEITVATIIMDTTAFPPRISVKLRCVTINSE